MQINARSVFLCCQYAVTQMVKQSRGGGLLGTNSGTKLFIFTISPSTLPGSQPFTEARGQPEDNVSIMSYLASKGAHIITGKSPVVEVN
jgi:NAD(P)-dependent dehydrogenase (short-subunit alcohol dehydrogenase family)